MNQLRKSSNHKISSCQGGQRQSVWRPPISIWQTCISGHQQGKARKGNLVCSEKVQFAPQSRNCEVEGELARDKTSSIFTVEEEVAVFENWSKLLRNSTMMSIVLVITHSKQGGKNRLTGIRLKNLDAYCHATIPCGAKKCTSYKSNSENNLFLSQSSFQVNCLVVCILVLEFSIFLHLAKWQSQQAAVLAAHQHKLNLNGMVPSPPPAHLQSPSPHLAHHGL